MDLRQDLVCIDQSSPGRFYVTFIAVFVYIYSGIYSSHLSGVRCTVQSIGV